LIKNKKIIILTIITIIIIIIDRPIIIASNLKLFLPTGTLSYHRCICCQNQKINNHAPLSKLDPNQSHAYERWALKHGMSTRSAARHAALTTIYLRPSLPRAGDLDVEVPTDDATGGVTTQRSSVSIPSLRSIATHSDRISIDL